MTLARLCRHALRPALSAAAVCMPALAAAHALVLTAQGEGGHVAGEVHYTDGTPAAGIYVSASIAVDDGKLVAEGSSGADGRFLLTAPAGQRLRVVAEGEEGHRSEVIAEPVALAAGTAANETTNEAAVATLRLLREDIARMEHRLRLQDIIGGIGYIVGIAGIAAWIAARRRQ